MPYHLYIGDTSSKTITFNDFKNAIGAAHAGKVALVGGKTEIREKVDPSKYPTAKQQELDEFMMKAVLFYVVHFESLEQAQSTQEKLDESDLPFIFFIGTHGTGSIP